MKLAIVGSRTFRDYKLLCESVAKMPEPIEEIISGGASGADSLAERYAKEHNIPMKVFPAEWDKYGKSAGYRRNKDIINRADYVIAFWDGMSKGTKHSIDLAKSAHKPTYLVHF